MAADAIVIKIKFAKSFGELNARMERGNDQQNIRVVGRSGKLRTWMPRAWETGAFSSI